ncbi:Protein CBR-LEC-8 [Caenorhabditis briggsae]|uniref:Galectin n=2 Tax=Caenorhabditis briggsae TaxID=6238 RepID=A0AAE9JRK8_CAEBR|nr:Protein CBR-LEC-8 [Caenorhabditis briggsae]ULT80373.1 hypothetical protein L3Y34_010739 [Caenorhabditis briggsae]UMM39684.1 hypothetical protein L5515_016624 [Caenorhabditis briggsae]CAP23103.1 Protein CBR-LEC-8 [Caenorhabditis briggsae]
MHVITSPDVPSAHAIREQLRAGTEIHVAGHVTHHHHKDFSVELLSGPHIVLHVNFRFEHGHRVAMNTSVNGQWGSEIDHHNPLKHHDHFDLKIHVHEGYYHISVNGEHLADFPHRLPYQSVQAVGLKGAVHVDQISFTGFDFGVDWNSSHDFGHTGYGAYGTETYVAPVFQETHSYNAYF